MMVRHAFVAIFDAALIVNLLDQSYVEWVNFSKEDDALFDAPQDALAAAGYPTLEEVLKVPELAELVVGNYLLHELLSQFVWNGAGPMKYWLDQITRCEVETGIVKLIGICYSKSSKADLRNEESAP